MTKVGNAICEMMAGASFYQAVLVNMTEFEAPAGVRFGTTGRGIYPNYEVQYPDGTVRAYRGRNHQLFFGSKGTFNPGNLSGKYTYDAIKIVAG